MYKPNTLKFLPLAAAIIVFGGVAVFSQANPQQNETSFEATLFVLIGSDDDTQKGDVPKSLGAVSKQIRDTFTFRNYRLMNTYYGRLANNGSLDYKSVSSLKNVSTDLDSPTFLDWQLSNFKSEPSESLSVQMFRFGARVPIVVSQPGAGDGKALPLTNYESVGLTLNRLSVAANVPTLIGTISLPRTTGTVFLVLAIKQA